MDVILEYLQVSIVIFYESKPWGLNLYTNYRLERLSGNLKQDFSQSKPSNFCQIYGYEISIISEN